MNEGPPDGYQVKELPLVLEASPFQHEDPLVGHRWSHWQVREEAGTYSSPVIAS